MWSAHEREFKRIENCGKYWVTFSFINFLLQIICEKFFNLDPRLNAYEDVNISECKIMESVK